MPHTDSAEARRAPALVMSARPVTVPAPGRGDDLQLRVTVTAAGGPLPVVVFSHGFGWSMDGYSPLVDAWAAQGFAVIQPTHLDSRSLAIPPDDPRTPTIWRSRVEDLRRVVDELDLVEEAVPGLTGRLDRDRIAVAGHSWGAQSASMLLGARILDADGRPGEDLSDQRVKAGVLLAVTGRGGAELAPFAAEHFPFMHPSFDRLTTPTLVVAGDRDQSVLSSRGPDWFTDAYVDSPGAQHLLLLNGAEHSLGGIAGHGVAETTDENPDRVAVVQRLTAAFLHDALVTGRSDWPAAAAALADGPVPLGRLDSK